MLNEQFPRLILLTFLGLLGHVVVAGTVEFSATAVQTFPQGESKTASMNIGSDGVRREYVHNNETIIEIYRPSLRKQYLIMPQKQIYQVADAQNVDIGVGKSGVKSTNPCKGMAGETCKLLGKEKVNGRDTDKWEVSRVVQGTTLKALIWVDTERGQALRQFFPDGSVVELVQTGQEKIGDRMTEKWIIKMSRPDGHTEQTYQWYDPEIGIIIKEVMPGGYIRELQDIKLGKQDSRLFEVPANYKQVPSALPR